MQHSDNSKSVAMVTPLFTKDWELSIADFKLLETHIFSKIPVTRIKNIALPVSSEFSITLAPHVYTTYVFKIADFKKKDQTEAIGLLQYKVLPFVSPKLLQNPQLIYEIEITIGQKSPRFYHLWLSVKTETQVKNLKRIRMLDMDDIKHARLAEKRAEDERLLALVSRARKRTINQLLNKYEGSIYDVGDLRDFNSAA